MILHILSDLHIEFAPFEAPQVNADVVILAGDVHVGTRGLEWILRAFPHRPVLYVLGNHEFYGRALPKLTRKLRELAAGTNVHIMENDGFELGGVSFLAATLWTDFLLFGDAALARAAAARMMSDYRMIRVSPEYRRLRPLDTSAIHSASKRWLGEELAKSSGNKLVVITHHAPSRRSLPARYREDLVSAAFASDLDRLVEQSGAELWIHGHVHEPTDYCIGRTRVISNPRGYPEEWSDSFEPALVVEV